MRQLLVRLAVALLTFTVGVCASTVWLGSPGQPAAEPAAGAGNVAPAADPLPTFYGPTHCTFITTESPEEKAVRLAGEFIARNGYTSLPPGGGDLSYETVETADSVEGLMLDRFDTLEPRAYGFAYDRSGKGGYTVVFRYTNRMGDYSKKVGRAVTMDKDLQNLRVEHKDFLLKHVHKKF